jgi:hypothetical protein
MDCPHMYFLPNRLKIMQRHALVEQVSKIQITFRIVLHQPALYVCIHFSKINSNNYTCKNMYLTFSGANFRDNRGSDEELYFDLAIQGDSKWNIIKLHTPIMATGLRKVINSCYNGVSFCRSL